MKERLLAFGLVILILAGIFLFFWVPGAFACWQKLSDSGMDYRYKIIKGCQYKTKDGGYLSYDRLRDTNE